LDPEYFQGGHGLTRQCGHRATGSEKSFHREPFFPGVPQRIPRHRDGGEQRDQAKRRKRRLGHNHLENRLANENVKHYAG